MNKKLTHADIIRAKNEISGLGVCIGLIVDKNPERILLIAPEESHNRIREIARQHGLNEYPVDYKRVLMFGYD